MSFPHGLSSTLENCAGSKCEIIDPNPGALTILHPVPVVT